MTKLKFYISILALTFMTTACSEPPPKSMKVDDSDPGATYSNVSWGMGASTDANGGGYRHTNEIGARGAFTFAGMDNASVIDGYDPFLYNLYMTWTPNANRSSNIKVIVYHHAVDINGLMFKDKSVYYISQEDQMGGNGWYLKRSFINPYKVVFVLTDKNESGNTVVENNNFGATGPTTPYMIIDAAMICRHDTGVLDIATGADTTTTIYDAINQMKDPVNICEGKEVK